MSDARYGRTLRGVACALALGLIVAGCGGGGGGGGGKYGGAAAPPKPAGHAASAAPRFKRLSAPAHPVPHSVRVPILTYHRVHQYATELTKSQPDLTIEPGNFRDQMAALRRAGYHTITQAQLFDAIYRSAALPRRPVIVSVDDGYVDDVTQILPVLRRNRMVATFYVITGRTHEPGFLSARQIRSLDSAGMDVGAHTRTHANLPALPATVLRNEVAGSHDDLQRILGHPVYWFAYPFGAFNPTVVDAVRRAGFLLAVTTRGGSTAYSTGPYAIPRIHVGRSATAQSVVSLAGGP
ncbi:MAG: hypothetical protein QOK25_1909 [Thermoleophilaceae bacterium]|nr:hypothetical protein [Thermoleophilaceae bacterium]